MNAFDIADPSDIKETNAVFYGREWRILFWQRNSMRDDNNLFIWQSIPYHSIFDGIAWRNYHGTIVDDCLPLFLLILNGKGCFANGGYEIDEG